MVRFFLHLSGTTKRRNRHFAAQIIRHEWACQRLLQRLRFIWEWGKNKQHEKTVRGWEEMANEQYPLLSTASPLFWCFVFRVPLSLSPLITMWTPWGGIKTDNKAGRELWRHVRSCKKKKAKRLIYYFTTQYYSVENDALYKYHQFYSVFTIAFYGFA